ncbi:MAG: glycosyltransferase [Betaproteobacteria bacterium]|nr:MAG: glycosyltransferase [Betaproteobacteria bacterium]
MRILMISDVYFPRVNGVSTSIQTFRHELQSLGHEITLVVPDYPAPHADDNGIKRVAARTVPFDPEDRMMKSAAVRALTKELQSAHYDLVHIQTPFVAHYLGVKLAKRMGIACVETYHTFFEEYLYHYIPFIPRAWLRSLARRFARAHGRDVDELIVPSSAMRDRLLEYGVTTPMSVLPTGIPEADFSDADGSAFRRKYNIESTRPMLLFVGRVAFEKNIDFLIRSLAIAVRSVSDLLLVIAGEGPALPRLRREVAKMKLDDNVLFIGYLDRARELPGCYAAADAFVFASRTETQGLVLLEAMALGVPVISLAVMGTCDIVNARRGALVPRDNESDFASSIVKLAGDDELRLRLAREAREYAREWKSGVIAGKLVDLYEQVVDRHSSGCAGVQPA